MTLRVIGAGVGRTGTMSLKQALERLLGGPCYHMIECFGHPEHVPLWQDAAQGTMPDWDKLFDGYRAAVDWPASAFWEEIAAAYPDALILHSVRDAESWWKSASNTIFPNVLNQSIPENPWLDMVRTMMRTRFTPEVGDKAKAIAAYEAHNARVMERAPRDRLLVWKPGDGWAPICDALGLAVPDEPFPHTNTTEEFKARTETMREEMERRRAEEQQQQQ